MSEEKKKGWLKRFFGGAEKKQESENQDKPLSELVIEKELEKEIVVPQKVEILEKKNGFIKILGKENDFIGWIKEESFATN